MFPKIKTEKKAERQKKKKKKKKKLICKKKMFISYWQFINEKENKLGEHATGIETFRDKGQLKI